MANGRQQCTLITPPPGDEFLLNYYTNVPMDNSGYDGVVRISMHFQMFVMQNNVSPDRSKAFYSSYIHAQVIAGHKEVESAVMED